MSIIFILGIMYLKYRPVYGVIIAGEEIGTVENKNKLEDRINEEILNSDEKNIVDISLKESLKYELKFQKRSKNTNENEIIEKIQQDNITIVYKYYEIALNNETKAIVDSFEEAEEIISEIKKEFEGDDVELNLQINEKYTENYSDVDIESIQVASNNIKQTADEIKEKIEEENAIAVINNVKLEVLPITGRITSRYGESSSIRSSRHTGLDIATSSGTKIKAVSSGTVIFSAYNGSYGNLIKIDHGNGVETWYGHCSKLISKVGDKVEAGDVISLVGSTGNSTGPHLHFEIRINGNTVNPQNYLY